VLIMTTFQDIGDGEGVPPRKIPWAGSWYVPFRSMLDEIDDCIGHSPPLTRTTLLLRFVLQFPSKRANPLIMFASRLLMSLVCCALQTHR
jgi:hypothetical protein